MASLRPGRIVTATGLACAIPFAVVALVPGLDRNVPGFLAFHNAVEFFSIMVSLSVFGVGWFAYRQSRDCHALFLGGVFLATGLIDFLHTLSNPAMPAFLTENSHNKSTQLWLAARLLNAGGLLASAFVDAAGPRPWLTRRTVLTAALAPAAAVGAAVLLVPEHLPVTYVPGAGLTAAKVGAEWVVIAVLAGAAVAYARRFRASGDPAHVEYLAACVVGMFGEAAFASYRTGFDALNALGHVYKVVAFALIYRAAVGATLAKPWLQLSTANERLRAEIAERQQAEERVRSLNAELERRVADRTAGLEAAHAALREAGRRKDDFLGMLSHELRNPLAPIHNAVHLLERAGPASEQAARARAVIGRQAEHLARLVDDLLDVTRIARGKIELRRERIDLADVVRRAAEDFRTLVEDPGLALHVTVPAAPLWCDADPTRITQVVGNLLHNAAKYTAPPGEVEVTLAAAGPDAAELRVRDTGAGIEPALLPHLFEAFVQGPRSLARSDGGLGLGLALVKGIVELHGGSVSARSDGPGRGAEVRARLPLAAAAAAEAPPPAASGSTAPRRILVVDDNVDAAETLSDLLRMLGHAVDVAYDGPSALARARASHPDVVLCDLGLPGMSGYDVARALRAAAGAGRPVRLLAVSGYAQPEDVRRAAEAGFDGHVSKPCDLAVIERLIR
jgi:signal transduction histidine kinase/CheY-like chemotaxis protein